MEWAGRETWRLGCLVSCPMASGNVQALGLLGSFLRVCAPGSNRLLLQATHCCSQPGSTALCPPLQGRCQLRKVEKSQPCLLKTSQAPGIT